MLELRLFCAEFLLHEALSADDLTLLGQEMLNLSPLMAYYKNVQRTESRPYFRRTADLVVLATVKLYEKFPRTRQSPGQAFLQSIMQHLTWLRQSDMPETAPDLTVLFFLNDNPDDGFVLLYPAGNSGSATLYPLSLTRENVKNGVQKAGGRAVLPPGLVQAVLEQRKAGRVVQISWSDETAWARLDDALQDSDWPFEEFPIKP